MEKRWSERKQLCVGVDIYQAGELVDSGRSADIGLGGIFLGVDSAAGVPKDTNLELVFSLLSGEFGEGVVRHRVSARVARITEQGVGLKFCDFDTGVFRSLQEIMSYQVENGAASCSTGLR